MQRNSLKPRLRKKYEEEVVPLFLKKENFKNKLQVPRIEKVVINSSLGKAIEDSKLLPHASEIIAKITGQKPVITKAKKSIAAFKLRAGMPIGTKVTLRGNKMYEFLDRLISTAIPRVRDFRGLSTKAFDGKGNYTIGIAEVTVFPEAFNEEENFGIEISIVTTAKNNEDAGDLLTGLGSPLKKSKSNKES